MGIMGEPVPFTREEHLQDTRQTRADLGEPQGIAERILLGVVGLHIEKAEQRIADPDRESFWYHLSYSQALCYAVKTYRSAAAQLAPAQ